MKIPRYWARETYTLQAPDGEDVTAVCWRWSDTSLADAQQQARIGAQQLAGKLLNRQHLDRYDYGDRPMREEVIQAIPGPGNQTLGVVTRNAYGALVLNAAGAMFIDIDFQDEDRPRGLFGKQAPPQENAHLDRIEQWAQRNTQFGLRVYRTFGGLRCLITNQTFDPMHESTHAILTEMESDPLYVKLCRGQGCFRARLTPKPWRCGIGRPPSRYPWETVQDEMLYRRWEETYDRAAAGFTVCRLVKEIGVRGLHPEVAPIASLHDRMACATTEMGLA
jgi:hypothetical protein